MFVEATDESERTAAVLAMAESADHATALMGLQWAAVLAENDGDIAGAAAHAARAMTLVDERTSVWQRASLHTHLAMLAMHAGNHRAGTDHAALAWPLLLRLHAYDDAVQVRAGMAMAALMDADVDTCSRILDEIAQQRTSPSFGSQTIESATRAELALARGDVQTGLRLYLDSVEAIRAIRFSGMETTGFEPWTVVAEAAALMAHARYAGTPAEVAVCDELAAVTVEKARAVLVLQPAHLDFPVSGMSFAAIAAWLLRSGEPEKELEGIHLLALAERFSYNRTFPVMAWAPLTEAAEKAGPGRLATLLAEHDGRPRPDLIPDAIAVLTRVAALVGLPPGDA
jgi:hypothetical protein